MVCDHEALLMQMSGFALEADFCCSLARALSADTHGNDEEP